jgi:outer membrane protein TolC
MKSKLALIGLAAIFAMPAKALDGTPSPAIVPPVVGVSPSDIQNWHNPNLQRAAKELLEQSRQLRRAGDEVLAQANPGGATLKEQLVGAWSSVQPQRFVQPLPTPPLPAEALAHVPSEHSLGV